jgi:flagellar hook-associated protein 2
MSLALSGLASGFDWKSIVDQLIEVSRAPQNRMRTEKSQLASKNNALNEIKGLISSLKSGVTSLGADEAVLKKSATFASGSTDWTASATKDTPAGQYSFNLTRPATAAKWEGATGIAKPSAANADTLLSSMNVGRTINSGSFFVNGAKIDYDATQPLENVLVKIRGVTGITGATFVDDKIKISSDSEITLRAANDTGNFLQAMKLSTGSHTGSVSSSSALGSISLSGPISSANFSSAVSNGEININGVSITYAITDSVQAVLNRINQSAAGVNAFYDLANGKFSLTNKTTGDVGISVVDSGGLATAMGLVGGSLTLEQRLTPGLDAEFTLNGGGTLTSRSNTLDETAHGIKGLSIVANSTGNQSVTVASDSAAAKASLNDFINKYNSVQNAIEKYTKVTTNGDKVTAAVLAGNRELAEISRSLRQMLYQQGSGVDGGVKRLSDLGINFAGIENTISITDSAKLDSALANSADDISDYFKNSTGGLVTRMDAYLDKLLSTSTSSPGSFKTQSDSITKQDKSLDTQIANLERQLASQRSLLESSFIAMEKAQAGFQQQSAYLARTFSNGSK